MKDTDPRLIPLRDFAYATFFEARGVHMVISVGAIKGLKVMLAHTQNLPEYELPALQEAWLHFLHSKNKFHVEQGDPLRFFASNIVGFMSAAPKSVEVAKTWLRGRIGK